MIDEFSNIRELPDDRFPDFLFVPIRNVFENDIYDKDFFNEKDPVVIRARSIRGKTKKLDRYLSDIEAYENYMQYLADTEAGGDRHLLENFIEGDEDEMMFFMPLRPKLKKNTPEYDMLALGVRPSMRSELPDYDAIVDAHEEMYPELDRIEERVAYDPTARPKKALRKELKQVFGTSAKHNRIRGLYSGAPVNDSLELIKGFISRYGDNLYETNEVKLDNLSISELIKVESDEKYGVGVNREPMNTRISISHNGRTVSEREERNLEIMKILYQASGIETAFDVANKGGGMRKSAVKLAMRQVGITEPVGKKEMKKMKKKEKKRKRTIEANLRGNRDIAKTLSRNKFTFDDNDDILAMQLGNLFGDK